MASERMNLLALVALLAIIVYLLDGLLVSGLGGGLVRMAVVAAGGVTALMAPRAQRWIGRIRLRAHLPYLEALRKEFAVQTSAQGVAEVLLDRVLRLTGARAVTLQLGSEVLAAIPHASVGEPSACFSLGVLGETIGEVRCYGTVRNERMVRRLLPFGALAVQNAQLAEQASAAELARSQAQALRDLRHRLTWTVTTQLCTLLDETRECLEAVRGCAQTLPPEVLARDLDALSDRLRQLEGFVHVNLKNANSVQAPPVALPLARFSHPR